jgi:hypothetical protein
MNIRSQLFAVLCIISLSASAQDKIFKKDGKVIESKVKAIGDNTIVYKRFDNQDGPEYTLFKNEVNKIVYENGTTDNFNGTGSMHGKAKGPNGKNAKSPDNILAVIPGAYTAAVDGTMNDVGIGLSYERLADNNGHFGLLLPLMINFSSKQDYANNYYYGSSTGYSGDKSYRSVMFAPGAKFYPARKNETVRYALGFQFFALFGKEPYEIYDGSYTSSSTLQQDWKYNMFGMIISNSVSLSVAEKFYMEFFINGCIPFSDNRFNNHTASDNLFAPFIQFGFKMGGRF